MSDPMLRCPVCRQPLTLTERTAECENHHSFDRAKSGYLNLLLSQRSGDRQHGDDRTMVRARRAFLDAGYYQPLADAILSFLPASLPAGGVMDAGCGEGWYTVRIGGKYCRPVLGVDISKEAVNLAAKRGGEAVFAVASVFSLPVTDGSAALIANLFAPLVPEEYFRCLTAGGYLLKVMPGARHLYELKERVYDSVYETETDETVPAGFTLVRRAECVFPASLPDHGAVADLFSMTPYSHNTTSADLKKLDEIGALTVTCDFVLLLFRKEE